MDMTEDQIQPLAVKSFTDAEIDEPRNTLLKLNCAYHTQLLEMHIKFVIKVSSDRKV